MLCRSGSMVVRSAGCSELHDEDSCRSSISRLTVLSQLYLYSSLQFMSRLAKSDNSKHHARYFVEEQMSRVATAGADADSCWRAGRRQRCYAGLSR
jgi:hypothetical protein